MSSHVVAGDRIIQPMIALAGCSTRHRIVVAGSKSMELMLELHRHGYLRAAATGNCGRHSLPRSRRAPHDIVMAWLRPRTGRP